MTTHDYMDADELAPRMFPRRNPVDLEQIIELEDLPFAEAVCDVCVAVQPAEPDVGISHAYAEASATVHHWRMGGLILTRADLVTAIGEAAVDRIEERAAETARIATEQGEMA